MQDKKAPIIYVNFTYKYYFVKGDEIVCREFTREVSDEFYAVMYAFDWLRVYEDKYTGMYGDCFAVKVYETEHPYNTLCWVEKDL